MKCCCHKQLKQQRRTSRHTELEMYETCALVSARNCTFKIFHLIKSTHELFAILRHCVTTKTCCLKGYLTL